MDRLVWLLRRFDLRAKVFQAGLLGCAATYPGAASPDLGYLHVLRRGRLRVHNAHGARVLIDEPSVFFYLQPVVHTLKPEGDGVSMVCATFEFGLGAGNPLGAAVPEMTLLRLE